MAQQIEEERLPYIEFEKRFITKHAAVDQIGDPGFLQQDIILITPLGSRDRIEKLMPDHLKQMKQQVAEKRIPARFYEEVKGAYEKWKKDEEFDFGGTPIEVLGLSKSQNLVLRTVRVRTVEDLAAANESLMEQVGMGARALKERARVFVEKKPEADRAAELADLRQTLKNMQEVLSAAVAQNESLRNEIRNSTPASHSAPSFSRDPQKPENFGLPSDDEIGSAVASAAAGLREADIETA